MNTITLATAQFPVSANIDKNLKHIITLTKQAKTKKAHLIHFSECCLGGYGGIEFENWDNYNWKALKSAETEISCLAKKLKIGIVYGSHHRASPNDIRNSLRYVSQTGKRVTRYDKRFCTKGDLNYYTSGKKFATFDINGFKFGLLICYDIRFPELYREYKKLKVQIMLHSFYNARAEARNIHSEIMRPTLQARAATNYIYVSANNSSGYYQSWPSVFIRPDGTIKASCTQHKSDLMINTISKKDSYYDASSPYRNSAMSGKLFSE